MKIRTWCLGFVAFAAMATVAIAAALPASENSVVDENRVLFALAVAHVPVRSASVEFLTPITLREPRATLKVERIEKAQGDSALARISCPAVGECVPFFVILHWSDAFERETALGPVRAQPSRLSAKPVPSKPILVRAGQSATLLLDNAKIHISTPIICLQNGSQGQQIRVSSLDHKRIALAEVIDSGVLRGTL